MQNLRQSNSTKGAANMNKDVIIALDFQSKEEVVAFLSQFPEPVYTKVGMELFYKEGPEIVKYLKQEGHKVFLV